MYFLIINCSSELTVFSSATPKELNLQELDVAIAEKENLRSEAGTSTIIIWTVVFLAILFAICVKIFSKRLYRAVASSVARRGNWVTNHPPLS